MNYHYGSYFVCMFLSYGAFNELAYFVQFWINIVLSYVQDGRGKASGQPKFSGGSFYNVS